MDTKVSTTSERIKEAMREKGFKQVDVIKRAEPICEKYDIKFPKSALSQYVNGKFEPDQNKLFVLAYVFDVSEAWLMGYDVPKERRKKKQNSTGTDLETIIDWIDNYASSNDIIEIFDACTKKLRK